MLDIDVSKYDTDFFLKSIQKRIQDIDCVSLDEYYLMLEHDLDERQFFINSLQIAYSEFFRNQYTFHIISQVLLPTLILNNNKINRNEIRIWSAACASGQESYSLAIILNEYKNHRREKINFRIFATDQSEEQINEASKGLYSTQMLDNVTLKRLNEWFVQKEDNLYQIKQELKKDIDFSVFDLLSEEHLCPTTSIYGDFDIIFCANVLFYYKPEYRRKILDKLTSGLASGGYLITGETEREILISSNLKEVYPQSGIFRL